MFIKFASALGLSGREVEEVTKQALIAVLEEEEVGLTGYL